MGIGHLALPLPQNWLDVLPNNLQVPSPGIAKIGSRYEHLAAETERKVCFVLENDREEQRPIVYGVADVVHSPAMNFRITLA